MKLFYCLVVSALLLMQTLAADAQTKKDSLTIEKALSRYTLGAPVLSPDGRKALVAVTQYGLGDKLPATHIWLADLSAKTIRQLTNSAKSESDPRWSPDGKYVSFLSARDGESQVYLLDMSGGEALPLTTAETGVNSYAWNPQGNSIAYVSDEPATEAQKKREEEKYDEQVVSETAKAGYVYLIEVNTKKLTRLSRQQVEVNELQWFPNGEALLLFTHVLPATEMPQNQLIKLTVRDSSVQVLPSPAHPFWGDIKISPDGTQVAYIAAREDGPTPHDLFIQSLQTGKVQNLTAKSIDLPVEDFQFTDAHHLLAAIQKGFIARLYKISDDGKSADYGVNRNVGSFAVAADGRVVFASSTSSELSELWQAGADQKAEKLSHFNKAFDSIPLVQPRLIRYASFDGTQIEAALYKPVVAGNKPLPLVVLIHGGPTGAFTDNFSAWAQLFVQKGYAVFCPNIRGSLGYGWNFIIANRNDWGGADFKDIMTGVDVLIAKENIDSNRMGISGWSYGGYMSEWAITQTNRFKAAMSGAGLANLASEFGTESDAYYDRWFFGTPYENADNFLKHSPITFIKNAKTPTLIIQGLNDDTDPVGQSQELYRGLRYYQVPTELVLYPGEPHGFRKIKHQIDFYRRMLEWFDKYVH